MITAAVILILVAGLVAGVAWLRRWYYDRRENAAIRQELVLKDELQVIRYECDRLFWELGEAQ